MTLRLTAYTAPRADQKSRASLQIVEDSRCPLTRGNAGVKPGIQAIDLISQASDWNLGHNMFCVVLPTLDTLLKYDDKPSIVTESINVAKPRIDYMLGSCRNRKPTEATLTRFDLDLSRLRRVKLKIIKPLRNQVVYGKISRSQPRCEPSADGILEMKATTRSRAGP